jgi:hypothetical protein
METRASLLPGCAAILPQRPNLFMRGKYSLVREQVKRYHLWLTHVARILCLPLQPRQSVFDNPTSMPRGSMPCAEVSSHRPAKREGHTRARNDCGLGNRGKAAGALRTLKA